MGTQQELEALAQALDGLIVDRAARIALTVETGYDETGMVGTRDAYLRLARQLLTFVAEAEQGKQERWDIYGKPLPGSATDVADVFASRCEVHIDTVCLTDSEEQTRKVRDDFRIGSPPATNNF